MYSTFHTGNADASEAWLKSDLEIISTVSRAPTLSLNEVETKVILFIKNKEMLSNQLFLRINDVQFEFAHNCENLGLFWDRSTRFNEHSAYILSEIKFII